MNYSKTSKDPKLGKKLNKSFTLSATQFNFIKIISKISLLALFACALWVYFSKKSEPGYDKRSFEPMLVKESPHTEVIQTGLTTPTEPCTHWSCVDVYRCGRTGDFVTVYIYPITRFVDEDGTLVIPETSQEYMQMLIWLRQSKYYVSDPADACLFVPSVDTMVLNGQQMPNVLANLQFWEDGSNHLIFNQLERSKFTGRAIHISAALTDSTYRPGFDVSIPLLPYVRHYSVSEHRHKLRLSRMWHIVVSRWTELPDWAEKVVLKLVKSDNGVTLLEPCTKRRDKRCVYNNDSSASKRNNMLDYPKALENADFCLIFSGVGVESALLFTEAVSAGCIPVLVNNDQKMVPPFPERIDWLSVTVNFNIKRNPDIVKYLESISAAEIRHRREKLVEIYERYMVSPVQIITTVMDILNERLFSVRTADTYGMDRISQISLKRRGFTAVILTYDRLESLRRLITILQNVPSLVKIVVVWNKVDTEPPSVITKSSKPVVVIRSKENKLTNRFYPYKEIDTEAVLSLDDDIIMLTPDELEFGYQVWCENSDKIVGFPSRLHLFDNATKRWKYESEWMNEVSMVLTGAAFYHVDYGRHFFKLPKYLINYVDTKFNCEDILMNFLVANLTSGGAPIKVAPRKKFKPDTTNSAANSLSASLNHMQARSECINEFSRAFGGMPLTSSQFRADPVLFKDNLPIRLKRFNQLGTL